MDETTGSTLDPSQRGAAVLEHTPPWSKVSFAPPEAWVHDESCDAAFSGKAGEHLTYLLWSRQMLADTGKCFHSTAIRLETAFAAQQESQWSVQLDPRTQSLTLHWLRIVRDGRRIDHLQRSRLRLVQRETQLEHLAIDGIWTLITVLEDVRPGDILEAAFSYETLHPIRSAGTEAFFVVPPQNVIARYLLSVVSDPSSALAAKTSADAPQRRDETLPDRRRRWTWTGSQPTPRETESNQPGTFLDYVWVQVSDLSDWRDLAKRVSTAWTQSGEVRGIDQVPAFARPSRVDEAAVIRLVRHVQDEFRYLSMDLELGGWIPSAPSTVSRRRYGDCKDLVWLTACILKSWGVKARPVLVGTRLREQVASLLPMTMLFNHAVLEIEFAGKKRWFDLTEHAQGGDFSSQAVHWFGVGLPIDANADGLCKQPGERSRGVYAVRETIWLDTRGGAKSLAEQRIWVEGVQADNLRQARQARGADEFAKDRAQLAKHRYGKARRVGALHWRDDREKNVCELVEAFEVIDAARPDETSKRAIFDAPANLVQQSFALPQKTERRAPWAMPYPLEIRHEITVKGSGLIAENGRRQRWTHPAFSATVDEPRRKGSWSKIVHFVTNAEAVSPVELPEFRKEFKRLLAECAWRVQLSWGRSHPRRGRGFGKLPRVEEGVKAYVPPTSSVGAVRPAVTAKVLGEVKIKSGGSARPAQVVKRRKNSSFIPGWFWTALWIVVVSVALGALRYLSYRNDP